MGSEFGSRSAGLDLGFKFCSRGVLGPDLDFKFSSGSALGPDLGLVAPQRPGPKPPGSHHFSSFAVKTACRGGSRAPWPQGSVSAALPTKLSRGGSRAPRPASQPGSRRFSNFAVRKSCLGNRRKESVSGVGIVNFCSVFS